MAAAASTSTSAYDMDAPSFYKPTFWKKFAEYQHFYPDGNVILTTTELDDLPFNTLLHCGMVCMQRRMFDEFAKVASVLNKTEGTVEIVDFALDWFTAMLLGTQTYKWQRLIDPKVLRLLEAGGRSSLEEWCVHTDAIAYMPTESTYSDWKALLPFASDKMCMKLVKWMDIEDVLVRKSPSLLRHWWTGSVTSKPSFLRMLEKWLEHDERPPMSALVELLAHEMVKASSIAKWDMGGDHVNWWCEHMVVNRRAWNGKMTSVWRMYRFQIEAERLYRDKYLETQKESIGQAGLDEGKLVQTALEASYEAIKHVKDHDVDDVKDVDDAKDVDDDKDDKDDKDRDEMTTEQCFARYLALPDGRIVSDDMTRDKILELFPGATLKLVSRLEYIRHLAQAMKMVIKCRDVDALRSLIQIGMPVHFVYNTIMFEPVRESFPEAVAWLQSTNWFTISAVASVRLLESVERDSLRDVKMYLHTTPDLRIPDVRVDDDEPLKKAKSLDILKILLEHGAGSDETKRKLFKQACKQDDQEKCSLLLQYMTPTDTMLSSSNDVAAASTSDVAASSSDIVASSDDGVASSSDIVAASSSDVVAASSSDGVAASSSDGVAASSDDIAKKERFRDAKEQREKNIKMLIDGCMRDDVDTVRRMLFQENVMLPFSTRDKKGTQEDVLLDVVKRGFVEIVSMLLTKHQYMGLSPIVNAFVYAVRSGNAGLTDTILGHRPRLIVQYPKIVSEETLKAADAKYTDVVEVLLRHIKEIDSISGKLLLVACNDDNVDLARLVLEYGKVPSVDFAQIVKQAAEKGRLTIMQLLLDSGILTSTITQTNALVLATRNRYNDVLESMIRHGYSPLGEGALPFRIAIDTGNDKAAKIMLTRSKYKRELLSMFPEAMSKLLVDD